jgi:hypothetical protein
VGVGTPAEFPAVAIFAGAKEALLRIVDFKITDSVNQAESRAGQDVHLTKVVDFTLYNPVQNNAGEFFPFLYTGLEQLAIPQARVIVGTNPSLPAVLVNGILVTPAIGPRYSMPFGAQLLVPNWLQNNGFQRILDWNDPPLRIAPFTIHYLRLLNPHTGPAGDDRLWINLWLSEREGSLTP